MRKILDKFKDRIVAITHKDIPPYDWQEAGYSNARAEAETDLKQEILMSEEEIANAIPLDWRKMELKDLAHSIHEAQVKKIGGMDAD